MAAMATDIAVRRRLRDGWFIYTCDAIPGLFVASRNDRKAYEDVPRAIKQIFKLDFGVDVSVANKVDYDNFFSQIKLGERARTAVRDRTRDLMERGDDGPTMINYILGTADDHRAS